MLQHARALVDRAGYTIYPKVDHFFDDQIALLASKDAPVVFDVGANKGKFVQNYRSLLPGAKIFCVEPIPQLAAQLRGARDDVEVIEAALSGEDGKASFYVNAFEDTSSLLSPDLDRMPDSYRTMMQPKESISVETARLDTLIDTHRLDRIDILKMDIQGGEYNALRGAEHCLSQGRISIIALEVFFETYYSDQKMFGDLAVLLAKHKYRMHRLYNINFSGQTGRPQWADAIFVAPDHPLAPIQ